MSKSPVNAKRRLLKTVVCPHCWTSFPPEDVLWIAESPGLVGDMKLGETPDCSRLEGLLRNKAIFGVDLIEAGLADRVCGYFAELTAGPGAVRATLHKYVSAEE